MLWLSDGEKIQRSDGFNMGFFKKCPDIIKDDILLFMNEFHENSKLPKAIYKFTHFDPKIW